jgi:hypothetical protein
MGTYALTIIVGNLTETQAGQLLTIIKSTVTGAAATITISNSTYQSNITG